MNECKVCKIKGSMHFVANHYVCWECIEKAVYNLVASRPKLTNNGSEAEGRCVAGCRVFSNGVERHHEDCTRIERD